MKPLRLSWSAPIGVDPELYIVRWLSNARETHGTETEIQVPDDFAGTIAVVAVENGIESGPCEVWFESYDLFIRWDDFHRCVIVSLPTDIRRRYVIERSLDQGRTWSEFADFPGTGVVESIGGGTEKDARFLAWSKAI